MKTANVLAVSLAVLFGALLLVNRAVLVAPIELSLGVMRFNAPLGLVLLGLAAALSAVFVTYLLKIHISALSATRIHSAELRSQRELAETAELSRYTELRQYLEEKLGSLGEALQASERRLQEQIATATNTFAACVGEIDERLERQWPTRPEQRP